MIAGAQPFFNDAIAGVVVEIKSTLGKILGLNLVNATPATAYLQVFNAPAASVNLGTTAPTFCVRLPANGSVFIGMSATPIEPGGTGISVAGTTTATGSTGAAISVTAFYA